MVTNIVYVCRSIDCVIVYDFQDNLKFDQGRHVSNLNIIHPSPIHVIKN